MSTAAPSRAVSFRFRNILYATDFSPCSERALPFLLGVAARFGSTISAIHVLAPQPRREVVVDAAPELDVELHEAERQMALLMLRPEMKRLTHQMFIERGPLWHVLEKVIQEREIDLIVLSTHGRRGMKKLALGSVAEEIFRRARCPVMTIGPNTLVEGAAEGRIGAILYAVDSQEGTKESLPYALGLAREHQAKLVLLHVLPPLEEIPPAEIEFLAAGVRQQLLNLPNQVQPGAELARPPEPIVVFGAAADEILRVAQQERAELIVMAVGRVGIGLAAAHLPWTTAHRVVCEAPCPVLTIRH